nr:Cen502 [uncultured bacterium]
MKKLCLLAGVYMWGTATAALQIEGAKKLCLLVPGGWKTVLDLGDVCPKACVCVQRRQRQCSLRQLSSLPSRYGVHLPTRLSYISFRGLLATYIPTWCTWSQSRGIGRIIIVKLICLNDNIGLPFSTLYDRVLPQPLQLAVGWGNPPRIQAFVQFAETMFREFHGKIQHWHSFNEPWCTIAFVIQYVNGSCPGSDLSPDCDCCRTSSWLAHGLSVRRFRVLGTSGDSGIAPNVSWAVPYWHSEVDKAACARTISLHSGLFLQPIFQGTIPQFLVDWFALQGGTVPIQDGDMEYIGEPIDMIGINYYSMSVNRFNPVAPFLQSEEINMPLPLTDIGWPLVARAVYEVLHYLQKYGNIDIYFTENGACYNHEVVKRAKVQVDRRISKLQQHFQLVQRTIHDRLHVKGYMACSLLDNFLRAEGYKMTFGMIVVDFRTQVRTGLESYYWYGNVLSNNWLETRPQSFELLG